MIEWWRLEHMASPQLGVMRHKWPSIRLSECCRWEDRVTHVVAPSLKRVAKVLAALAAGTWIVSTEFLDASHAARTLVEPVCNLLIWILGAPCLWMHACACLLYMVPARVFVSRQT